VVSVVASRTLRAALVDRVQLDERTMSAVSAFDWLDADGPDAALLGRTAQDLQRLQTPGTLLEFDRIHRMPVKDDERLPLSTRIVELVFERLGSSRPLSEAVLNAAIAMFCEDVAIVRRDAVDLGVVDRTDDGSSYRYVAAGFRTA
jgi:hypothetical protein